MGFQAPRSQRGAHHDDVLAGVASVLGLSLLGVLFLIWRAPVMNQPEEALEPLRTRSPSIDPA